MRKSTKGPLRAVLKMFKLLFPSLLYGSLLFNSCKGGGFHEAKSSQINEMELIVSENYSGFEEEQFIAIRNQDSLLLFYGKINRTRKPGLVPPTIDFRKEMLLVWCGGEQFTGPMKLELSSNGDNLFVKKIRANATRKREQPIVSPFVIYKLPLSSKNIELH